jgi:hypothetical protein
MLMAASTAIAVCCAADAAAVSPVLIAMLEPEMLLLSGAELGRTQSQKQGRICSRGLLPRSISLDAD